MERVRLLAPSLVNRSVMYSVSAPSTTALHNDQSLRDARAWLQPAVIIIIITFWSYHNPTTLLSSCRASLFLSLIPVPSLTHTPTRTRKDPLNGPLLLNVSGYRVSTWRGDSDNERMTKYSSPYGSALDCARCLWGGSQIHNYIRFRGSCTLNNVAGRRWANAPLPCML